jgi:hypothetical protein
MNVEKRATVLISGAAAIEPWKKQAAASPPL